MYLQSQADKRIKNSIPPPNSSLTTCVKKGNLTLRDSGALMRSIAPHSGDLWADCSTNLKQARILQYGGTIKAKGKTLWIPAGPETRRRMKGLTISQMLQQMKSDGWKFFKKGKLFCASRRNKSGKREELALFILKDSIVIPARPFLHIDQKNERYILHYLGTEISHALHPGKGGAS